MSTLLPHRQTEAHSTAQDFSQSRLQLNGLLETVELDEAGDRARVLYRLPDVNGRMQQIAVGQGTHRWLQYFRNPRSVDDVRRELLQHETSEKVDQFMQAVQTYFVPNKVLVQSREGDSFAPTRAAKPGWMALKIRLLSARLIEPVTRRLTWTCSPLAVAIFLILIVSGQIAFFVAQHVVSGQIVIGLRSEDILRVVGLTLFGMLAHEFGHATTARRHGCTGTEIGVGWYFYFPVFWADLSDSWRCSRKQRAAIDMGGTYYQAIYISAMMALFWTTDNLIYFYAAVVLNITLVFNLNPFLRLDGYWLISDLMGVPNLRRAASKAFSSLFSGDGNSDRQSNRRARWLLLYAIGSNLFFLYVLYVIIRHVIWRILGSIPGYLEEMLATFSAQSASAADIIVATVLVVWQFILIYFIGYLLISVSTRIWRRRSGRSNRPAPAS